MKLDIEGTFDSVLDQTKEAAEALHVKTNELHEKYVSKVLPDLGKYGEAAAFAAELAPGVSEYNAIKDGDWKAFAVSAGIDVTAAAAGMITAGAGFAAIKGGSTAAKAGVRMAAREIAEAGTKKVVKEAAETGTKKAVKEVTEAGAEKTVKEVAEAGADKTVKETSEQIAVKGVKEVGDQLDKKLIPDYLKDVEKITHREIKPVQMEKLQKALREQDFERMDTEKAALHRRLFDHIRNKLIKEWEENTGEKWPEYTQDVFNEAGEVIKRAGQRYDAHHLIESSFGGPNAWWNLHPAAFPAEHQSGIHASNSLAQLIF